MRIICIFGVVVFVAIAGCLGSTKSDGSSAENGQPLPGETSPPSELNNETLPRILNFFAGSQCHGFKTTFDAPAPWYSDEVPPEWRYEGPATKHYGFVGYECERIGLPSLERGPASLLIEFHANAAPPETCTGPGGETMRFVRNWYTTDAQIAHAVNATLGVEPIIIELTRTIEPVVEGRFSRYQWTSEHGASNIEIIRTDRAGPNIDLDDVWLGIGRLGPWRAEFRASVGMYDSTLVGEGTMSSETLHAKLYGSEWAGTTGNYGNVDFSAKVTRFTDLSCEEVA